MKLVNHPNIGEYGLLLFIISCCVFFSDTKKTSDTDDILHHSFTYMDDSTIVLHSSVSLLNKCRHVLRREPFVFMQ